MARQTATAVALDHAGLSPEQKLDLLRTMLRIRVFEDRAARVYTQGKAGGFMHLYNGQEASGVGAMAALRPDDVVMSHYRDHGYAIARGVPTDRLMAELFGRVDGVARGRGGSMHFYSEAHNFKGGWAIVGGQTPLAVGHTWATEYRRKVMGESRDDIGLVIMGDGATNIGYFYEALNFAALWDVPIIFYVENNGYAMGTATEHISAVHAMVDKAKSFDIPAAQVDGMDLLAVHAAVSEAAAKVRAERRPFLIEAITYRYRAHSMADPDLYRSKDEVDFWRERDPIIRFSKQLMDEGSLDEAAWQAMQAEAEAEIEAAVAFADASPEPPLEELMADILAEAPEPVPPTGETKVMTVTEALNAALDHWMAGDERAFIMGEDVNRYGGAYAVTRGLPEAYGDERVRDTPIAEGAIAMIATGAAMAGLRPMAELMTINFALLASDAIINHAAKIRNMFGGQSQVPLVVRAVGGGVQLGATHSQNFDALFAHVPGLRVAAVGTPLDAKGLLATALELDDPTVFLEHQLLYRVKGEVPTGHFTLPVGKAHVERVGEAGGLTLIGYSRGLQVAFQAADRLEKDFGLKAEVINLRWLRPLDLETLIASVKKTNRALVVEDDWLSYGVGAEVAASLQERAFDWLDAPVLRVAAIEAPVPYAANLERAAWPSADRVIETLRAHKIL
ncbi:MAG: pyruvate dehydrogenase (acetyl-transferring) E1 component subunit alpha [Caldilineae bacterium]|nr:pyruvate dehydrogenase (acetyl-transferring) E1 component subunit alpha [Chloroflexota bacterium]MCB9177554.1 pyruvate dehydrogenase (acetyl-transferring) E1 component subunit alpha [Caldilineae bacterium]